MLERPIPRGPGPVSGGELPSLAASEGLLAFRRLTFGLAAVVVASFYWVDVSQPRFAAVAAVRALWIGAFLAAAALQRPSHPRRAMRAAQLVSLATSFAVVTIIALDGGTASVYHGMLLATPFLVLLGVVEVPPIAAVNGAVCGIGGALIRLAEGQSWGDVAAWLFLSAVMSLLAIWSTVATRHAWQLGLAAERARLAIQQRLSQSEQQRVEAERLAEVGRLAARVAHEVNNPLAVVKSNVQWLGRAGAEADPAERASVVADTLESVERIVDAVDSVRRQAGERPYRTERKT
ncbi:MAG TPA: histidine kinase dimerization/phospho-acceptor domain-containing protein [Anaeromyxobacter sp.]|nr:histidine kinase dimerization/phospho-acceptor domain-containing protein [Anaeromyxobacter sp.]